MVAPGGANQIVRRVIDDLIEFSKETSVDGYISFFKSQQIAESHGFINWLREEANTARNLVGQLNALIAEMELVVVFEFKYVLVMYYCRFEVDPMTVVHSIFVFNVEPWLC
nr:hypothetical protein [Tanacetum cinerariifolium]